MTPIFHIDFARLFSNHDRAWYSRAVTLLVIGSLPGYSAAQQQWLPTRNVEIIVQAGPGGASDTFARVVQRLLQDKRLIDTSASVASKPGGGGSLAYNYLNQHPGDGHYLLVATSTLVTAALTGSSPFKHTDFSPVSILSTEYSVASVRADSPVKDGRDLLNRLIRNPQENVIGLSAAWGNANHIAIALAMKAVGGNVRSLKIVVFKASQESVTALLGGHLHVVTSPVSGISAHVESGKIRALAVNSAQRLKGAFTHVPTWKEQGVDTVSGNWRGILGPKNLTDAQMAYWAGVFARLSGMPEWKQYLEKTALEEYLLDVQKTRAFLESEYQGLGAILKEIGLKEEG